jgi:HAD superfamily hydrolase (TIGR01450 family)
VAAVPTVALNPPTEMFDGYAFDLDGTLYLGDTLLPGAASVVAEVRARGAGVVFATNNPLRTAAAYADRLTALGIPASAADVVTSLDALARYMLGHHPGATILPVAELLVATVLREHGFDVTDEPAAADVVVVAFDRTFDYAKLTAAYRAVRLHGAVIVATNPDPYCPTPDGGIPDCAAMLAAVEACTGATAEAVVGKPSRHMAGALLSRLGVPAGRAAVVGDRLSTDVALARDAGMVAILVLSGATSAADLHGSDVQPDHVVDGVAQIIPATARGQQGVAPPQVVRR